MPLHLRDNQYKGINAHLHSYLQKHGDWSMFHGEHVTHLREALQEILPPESGYFVLSEKSLQVIRDDFERLSRKISVPDVGIYKASQGRRPLQTMEKSAVPGAVVPLIETFIEPDNVNSVVIRKIEANDGDTMGVPITRIELLSLANKPPGSHYPHYLTNREETLLGGVNLVELDYLHERRSPIHLLPDYVKREANAYPYLVLVSSPYPTPEQGYMEIYGFRVDDPIPMIRIPLDDGQFVSLDLTTVYNRTFSQNAVYGLGIVDYAEQPENFDRYDAEDQRRIVARMNMVEKL